MGERENPARALPPTPAPGYPAGMLGHAADTPPTRRVPVEEAAKILGITDNAVRKRIERGTLRSVRDGDVRYVLLETDMPRHAADESGYAADMSAGMPSDQASTMRRLEDEVRFLRELVRARDDELRREREAREEVLRRHDTIVLRMTERIPELEPARDARDASQTASEGAGKTDVPPADGEPHGRSWWRRFFGL